IVALALGLRLWGLDAGLRHPPHMDERSFVENAHRMVSERSLDHRFYEYPGFSFVALAPVLALVGEPQPEAPSYYAARVLIAATGALCCLLAYALGRDLAGVTGGLTAALALAVSPVAVETAHLFRPDVLLQAASFLALLAFRKLGEDVGPDLLTGAALGLAGAIKFSAIFLMPSYFVARLLAPGPKLASMVRSGVVALVVLLLFTPVVLWRFSDFLAGASVQFQYHYVQRADGPVAYHVMALEYLAVWHKALGWPGTVLSVLGMAALAVRPRELWPLLLLPLTAILVLSTSDFRRERFLLPALSSAFALAGVGGAALAQRVRGAGVAVAACAAFPLLQTVPWLQQVAAPGTRDRVLDFLQTQAPAGSRILSDVPLLGLDGARYEVMEVEALNAERRAQAVESDYVLAGPQADPHALDGLTLAFRAEPETRVQGPAIAVYTVPRALRPAYEPVPLASAALSSSEGPEGLGALVDGRADPSWRSAGPQQVGDWIAVDVGQEFTLGRIELLLGDDPRFAARELRVFVSGDGLDFHEANALPGRADDQRARMQEPSQVFLVSPPVRARAVKLALTKRGPRRWGVAELRLFGLSGAPQAPAARPAG
ncbi:MAG TPA: glycosyltransferase family 39 protein, partial [Vicinamibacteria bacterium]|nr:glycosyltransferase family 39 protein [Vicinamibacteria bacterium]